MNTIEGVWLSRYEYTQGSDKEPSTSEHRIEFKPAADGWIGRSIPQPDGSGITIELTRNGSEFRGIWHERTAPAGHYEGREYSGLLMLMLKEDGSELEGLWLGASSSTGRVKSGSWILQRTAD